MNPLQWLIVFIILIGIEVVTLGLTTIWLAGGALAALIASALGAGLWVQLILFAAVSAVLVIFTRPVAARYFNQQRIRTNVDELIGKHAVVIENIDNLQGRGMVQINGQEWSARSADESVPVEKGAKVIILEVQGVKLICRKVSEDRPQE